MLRYFISREFFLTLLGLAGAGALLYIFIFFWFLPAYTRHGDAIIAPDLTEMPLEEAEKSLRKAGLRPTVADEIYMDNLPPGVVLRQYPAPYSRVKPGRTISLTINKKDPPMVALPELRDMSLYQAKNRLEGWKLAIGKVTAVPDKATNFVISAAYQGREVKTGDMVPQGAKIELVIGAGLTAGKVALPNLVGMRYEEALALLSSLRLNLGSVVYKADGPASASGTIFNQQPSPRSADSVAVGSSVDLFVQGQAPQENEGVIMETLPSGGNR